MEMLQFRMSFNFQVREMMVKSNKINSTSITVVTFVSNVSTFLKWHNVAFIVLIIMENLAGMAQ